MFPSTLVILTFILLAICIGSLQFIWPNRFGRYVEGIAIVASLAYLFITYSYTKAIIIFSFASMTYAQMLTVIDPENVKLRRRLLEQLANKSYKKIDQPKEWQRIALDITIIIFVSSGALSFLIWAPETFAVLKFFIGISFILIGFEMIKRIANYMTTSVYFLETSEQLIIISSLESRKFPIEHLEKIKIESRPDILRLHPLFTFLASMQDYTTSQDQVLRLNFPGEHIYLTPTNIDKWHSLFIKYIAEDEKQAVEHVKPLWHLDNLKRLLWKGYFAMTVKGISAYTGLLILLIWLNVPSYGIFIFIFIWWLFNMYVSDRVLISSTDAKRVQDGWLFDTVKNLSEQANIKQPELYLIDSPIHNGLATGMNIGRGTIMLTTATKQFSERAITAIIAHEIAHIRHRDILINQIGRMLFFAVVGLLIYFNFDYIEKMTENLVLLTIVIYLMMMLFPIYLSLISQFTEMRADYFASRLLSRENMTQGLVELGQAQDTGVEKSHEYSQMPAEDRREKDGWSALSRGPWLLRLVEFQFQLHPPLYFRIYSLQNNHSWKQTIRTWLKARLTESLPDVFGRKSKYS